MSFRVLDRTDAGADDPRAPPVVQLPQERVAPQQHKRTILEAVRELLIEMDLPENTTLRAENESAFRKKFDTDDRWEPLRKSAPRLWLKAIRGDLHLDDPYLQQMLGQLEQVKSGQTSLKQAWKTIDKTMTEKYVYPQVGRPDAQGRPTNKK